MLCVATIPDVNGRPITPVGNSSTSGPHVPICFGARIQSVRSAPVSPNFGFARKDQRVEVTGHKSTYGFSSSSTSSSMRSSSTIKDGTTTTTKNVSPFQKFKQMDANSSPRSTRSTPSPFSLTLPIIRHNAATIKKIILDFCKRNTTEYEDKGVKIENFSTSWNDGMAFCALIHHFYPDAFDFDELQPQNRRYNFDLAFRVAEEKAGVMPLLDVEDMVIMKKPDWKCVFTYVQSLYKRLKDQ